MNLIWREKRLSNWVGKLKFTSLQLFLYKIGFLERSILFISSFYWFFKISFRWLPLLLLMIYIFFFNLGYGAMIWITVVEILPLHVRSVATSLSVAFTCVCSFLTSHTYTDLKDNLSVEGVFWLYGSISFAGLLFILIFIPETKGKTATELRDYFTKRSRKPTVKERKTMTGQQRAAKMQ